jgi:hypothetical protein
MNEADRITFDLRNELAQEIEIGGREALADHLAYTQKEISKLARQACIDERRRFGGDSHE